MNEPTRQCAAVIIRRADGAVLALQQTYGLKFWGVPGGVVDPGETPAQAAVREAREEVGLQVRLLRVIGIYTLTGGGWPDICAYVFEGQLDEGESQFQTRPKWLRCAGCHPQSWQRARYCYQMYGRL